MKNRGKLVACDVAGWRLERAGKRLRRAGISNVERRALSSERDPWVKHHAKELRPRVCRCAVPRHRQLAAQPGRQMARHARRTSPNWSLRQRDILASAARLVKPGGRLVYATCSLLREENEAQAEGFLAAHADFALYPAARAWDETIGGALAGRRRLPAPDPGPPRHRRVLCRHLRAQQR